MTKLEARFRSSNIRPEADFVAKPSEPNVKGGTWPRPVSATDMLGRLAVPYPEIPTVFAGSRRFAEERVFRFLAAAVADRSGSTSPRGAAKTV